MYEYILLLGFAAPKHLKKHTGRGVVCLSVCSALTCASTQTLIKQGVAFFCFALFYKQNLITRGTRNRTKGEVPALNLFHNRPIRTPTRTGCVCFVLPHNQPINSQTRARVAVLVQKTPSGTPVLHQTPQSPPPPPRPHARQQRRYKARNTPAEMHVGKLGQQQQQQQPAPVLFFVLTDLLA